MKRSKTDRASHEGMIRLRASLTESLFGLGYTPGGSLHGLLSNSWAGREVPIDQAERALQGLRRRKLTPSQRAVVSDLADAIDAAKRAVLAPPSSDVNGTRRMSALLVRYPNARALRFLWADGKPAPRDLVEEALRDVQREQVTEWHAADHRELVRGLTELLARHPRANPKKRRR